MSNHGLVFNYRLIEVARKLVWEEWGERYGEICGEIKKIKREYESIGQPQYADRKVGELWPRAIKELGDIAVQGFVDVFAKANVRPYPTLAADMKRWVEQAITSQINGLLGGRASRHQGVVRAAADQALRKANVVIDLFVLTLSSADSSSPFHREPSLPLISIDQRDQSTNIQGSVLNSNVVIHSRDVNQTPSELFREIRDAIQSKITDTRGRDQLAASVAELEAEVGKKGFFRKYAEFMALAANHFEVFGPFIPVLTKLLGGG
jgi:hypothetical protein